MSRSFFCSVLAAVGFSILACDLATAQDRGRLTAAWGRGGGDIGLLMRNDIQNELGINDEQIEFLEEIQQEQRNAMRELFRNRGENRQNGEGFDWEAMREKMEELNKETEKKLEEVLEPFQMERLKQIGLQSRARRGTTAALESIASELDIDDEQLQELREAAEQARQDYEEKLAKARKEMEEAILKVLTSDQRQRYKEMRGEDFELDNRRRNFGREDNGNRRGNRRGEDGR